MDLYVCSQLSLAQSLFPQLTNSFEPGPTQLHASPLLVSIGWFQVTHYGITSKSACHASKETCSLFDAWFCRIIGLSLYRSNSVSVWGLTESRSRDEFVLC